MKKYIVFLLAWLIIDKFILGEFIGSGVAVYTLENEKGERITKRSRNLDLIVGDRVGFKDRYISKNMFYKDDIVRIE